MESNFEKKVLIIYIRHGERIDEIKELTPEEQNYVWDESDPVLSANGNVMASETGKLVRKLVSQNEEYS